MSRIFVCPLSQLEAVLQHSRARWMISLAGPGKSSPRPEQITGGFLSLEFNDIDAPRDGLVAPDQTHISNLLDFLDNWNWQDNLVIQCWMGISRSTAAASIAMARSIPPDQLVRFAASLRHASPTATPNPLMISIADDMLSLGGRFRHAMSSIGRGCEAGEGKPFVLERPA